jgi:hypothetical protein
MKEHISFLLLWPKEAKAFTGPNSQNLRRLKKPTCQNGNKYAAPA